MLNGWISRHWVAFTILVLALSAGWVWASRPPAGAGSPIKPAPQEGFMAPDFTSNTFTGEPVTLSSLKGKVVLVNFWASWCPPCRAEMRAIQNTYADDREQGLVVLAVNASTQDDAQTAVQFAQDEGLTFPLVTDPKGSIGQVYQVMAMPTSFFIDRRGKIARVVIGGPMAEALIRSQVETLLKESP